MLDNKLIENALALCEYMYDDFEIDEWHYQDGDQFHYKHFSIEKFCYYLLSLEFIEKYHKRYTDYPYWDDSEDITYSRFWVAIWKYQAGNEKPLTELLQKIK